MTTPLTPTTELESTLNKLSINPNASKPRHSPPKSKTKPAIADSWEDSDSGDEEDDALPTSPPPSNHPSAPPPTPISPSTSSADREAFVHPSAGPARRPEKTDAVARRLIAGALGVRAPKMTEEQRAYEKAAREKEVKRRNAEREAAKRAEEEKERAKAAVWDD